MRRPLDRAPEAPEPPEALKPDGSEHAQTKNLGTPGVYFWGFVGIMEKKMETTRMVLYRVEGM